MLIRLGLSLACLLLACLTACSKPTPPTGAAASSFSVVNRTDAGTTVYVSFGSDVGDAGVGPTTWPVCTKTGPLNCTFPIAAGATQDLPTGGKYLNATFSFGAPVACNVTKAEINMNNPAWSNDTADVSLVDGYSNKVEVDVAGGTKKLGPPNGAQGNEKVDGLFPTGCDICVARQNPPCGFSPGKAGCKGGTQYKPDVPCQWSGAKGQSITVALDP